MKTFSQFKNQQLKNRSLKKAYDELSLEFAIVQMIIERRLKRGFSQATLAKKLGTKQSAIARLESGRHNPSLHFLNRVATALDAKLNIRLS